MRAQRALGELKLEGDELVGAGIVRRSLEAPLRLIVQNAGQEGAVVLDAVRQHEDDYGYDAEIGEYAHMLQQGIVDPVKVTRSALQNAASVAGMVLTTESMITEIPQKEQAGGGPPGGMPPMDY